MSVRLNQVRFGYGWMSKNMKSALLVYFSSTGNTEKVALAIKEGLETSGVKVI